MELLLIRHGLPVRQENANATPADPALSPRGNAEAAAVARWLRDESIDALYASPLRRAQETAAPLAQLRGLEVRIEPGVLELDHASPTYIPLEQLKREDPAAWRAMQTAEGYAGVDMPEFRERIVIALEGIIRAHAGQRAVVVCHGGVINAFASEILGLADALFFEPAYTSINRVLAASTGERGVRSLNETGHLRDVQVAP